MSGCYTLTLNKQPDTTDKTRKMAPHPVVAHPRVIAKHRELVKKAFLDMAGTPSGAQLLSKVPVKKLIVASGEDYLILKKWGLDKYYVRSGQ
jgi:phosphonate transport system substrate-binding protein